MSDEVIGATAGNYRILSKIGDGGMGAVYLAEHVLIGRHAAIKVLLPEFTANRSIVNRFFNEAKATTLINHPGIVEVFDFGYLDGNRAYIVMELLEGRTLTRRIRKQGVMSEGDAAGLLRSICSALQAAHDKGIVHRDLKPDNIFLVPDHDTGGERPKLLDFGIAKLTDLGAANGVTKTGAVMGTPTYMSPEQCRGSGDVDHRADLYSIGCIFYQLLTGRPPFASHGAGEVLGMHLYVQPEPPSRHRADIAPEVDALIMALLAKDPAQRPQSARELAGHLQQIADARGTSFRSFGDVGLRPSQVIPPPVPASPPSPAASPTQPTTLSGAASQPALTAVPRRRTGLVIAGGVVGLAAIVALVLGLSGHGEVPGAATPRGIAPAAAPAPAAPAPAPAPIEAAPAPAPIEAAPAPAPAPVPVAPAPAPISPAPAPAPTHAPAIVQTPVAPAHAGSAAAPHVSTTKPKSTVHKPKPKPTDDTDLPIETSVQ